MKKASKDYQKIIKQLDELKAHCIDMDKGEESIWKEDIKALQEAIDIIYDYEKVVMQANGMFNKYETAEQVIQRDTDIYVCPVCGKRAQVSHSHCHWCGKKLAWNDISKQKKRGKRK